MVRTHVAGRPSMTTRPIPAPRAPLALHALVLSAALAAGAAVLGCSQPPEQDAASGSSAESACGIVLDADEHGNPVGGSSREVQTTSSCFSKGPDTNWFHESGGTLYTFANGDDASLAQ